MIKSIYLVILIFFMNPLSKFPDFENWKRVSIENLEKNCIKAEKRNDFYKDECTFFKKRIELLSVPFIEEKYQEALIIAFQHQCVSLKYYINYHTSGEVNDTQHYFIFQLETKDFLVVKYSSFLDDFSQSIKRKINKSLYCPKQDLNLKGKNCDHSAIVTTFKNIEIKKSDIILCPKNSYYKSLISLLD